MATGRLTEIIKSRRESGEGVTSSLAGGVKERLKEKFDPRRIFNQNGLLTALFPKLRAYKANVSEKQSTGGVLNQTAPSSDNLSTTKPLFESISVNTKIIAKNSMVLPLIQKDTNLMRQTLKKIVKAMQARKKVVPTTKSTPVIKKTTDSGTTIESLETEREQPEKEKGPIEKLLELIKETFDEIRKSITKTLTELPGKIISGIVSGIKGLFTATKIASSVLLSLLKPLLRLIFSPAGFALLLAAGVFWSLYKLSNYLTKKVAEEVPNMNALTPKEAAAALTASSRDMIDIASKAAGRKTPFTHEEAVNYLKEQIVNGPKIAEEGMKLVGETKRLEEVLKSGDKEKIEAEGGEESIKKKISELKIRIANLGGEKKFKEILAEGNIPLPPESEISTSAPLSKEALVNKNKMDLATIKSLNDADAETRKDLRANAAVSNTLKIEQEGYGPKSATSPLSGSLNSANIIQSPSSESTSPLPTSANFVSPSLSGNINVGLTSPSVSTQDGPGNSMPVSVAPPPKPVPTFTSNELQLSEQLNGMNENLAEQGLPYQDLDSDAFANYSNTYSNTLRIVSPLNGAHPDVIKALKIKMHEINSMIAY